MVDLTQASLDLLLNMDKKKKQSPSSSSTPSPPNRIQKHHQKHAKSSGLIASTAFIHQGNWKELKNKAGLSLSSRIKKQQEFIQQQAKDKTEEAFLSEGVVGMHYKKQVQVQEELKALKMKQKAKYYSLSFKESDELKKAKSKVLASLGYS